MNDVICSPTVTGWSATADEFSLLFENNPLAEFVELPDSCYNLRYSNILCGAIKGALEMVSCKRILRPPRPKLCTLEFQIDHTVGKNLHGWKNDIDNGARATEMCPDIKAIGIWLAANENL